MVTTVPGIPLIGSIESMLALVTVKATAFDQIPACFTRQGQEVNTAVKRDCQSHQIETSD